MYGFSWTRTGSRSLVSHPMCCLREGAMLLVGMVVTCIVMTGTTSTDANSSAGGRKPVRVWADGCFDMMHYGHANALRQAKALGDILVVGVHSDEEVRQHKGPPIMNEKERYAAVRACKWVDEVVEDAPYYTSIDWLNKYNIDFAVHGEDLSTGADGRDTYEECKKQGRFRLVKRTDGVSTTDIVGRMLLVTKQHHCDDGETDRRVREESESSPFAISKFIPQSTTRKILQFSQGNRQPSAADKRIYVDGSFDLFHSGHSDILRAAREFGDYLIVGVHDDSVVNRVKGRNFPIMNMIERTLSVLQCRYVDEVVMGAPFNVTGDILDALHIVAVVHGTVFEGSDKYTGPDPYAEAKKRNIYHEVTSGFPDLTNGAILSRVIRNRLEYEERQQKKAEKAEREKDVVLEHVEEIE